MSGHMGGDGNKILILPSGQIAFLVAGRLK